MRETILVHKGESRVVKWRHIAARWRRVFLPNQGSSPEGELWKPEISAPDESFSHFRWSTTLSDFCRCSGYLSILQSKNLTGMNLLHLHISLISTLWSFHSSALFTFTALVLWESPVQRKPNVCLCVCWSFEGIWGLLTLNEPHSPLLLLVCSSFPSVYLFLLLLRGEGTEAKPRQGLDT